MSIKKYNKYFSDTTNDAVDDLVKSIPTHKEPRINRKNGGSKLDSHYSLIQQKLAQNKSQRQIILILKANFNVDASKSALSRFISKKLRATK